MNDRSTELAKECHAIMHRLFDGGKWDSFKLSEELSDLDKKYPGLGFNIAAYNVYKRFCDRTGIECMMTPPKSVWSNSFRPVVAKPNPQLPKQGLPMDPKDEPEEWWKR